VILQGHAVCGAAHTSGHGLRNTALLFKQAVTELKQFVRHHHLDITTFVALFHVDYGNGLMRTYTFNADIFQ
jgi:hypothetical protein